MQENQAKPSRRGFFFGAAATGAAAAAIAALPGAPSIEAALEVPVARDRFARHQFDETALKARKILCRR